jgi:hypothetical protein
MLAMTHRSAVNAICVFFSRTNALLTVICSCRHFQCAGRKVLLNVLVGGKKHVETGPLRLGEQVAVGKPIPSTVSRLCDRVAGEVGELTGRVYCGQTGRA